MKSCADTSFLASLYVQDVFNHRAQAWLARHPASLPLTGFGRAELRNALARLVFTGALTSQDGAAAWQMVEADLRFGRLQTRSLLWDDVFVQAEHLAVGHTAQIGTRTLDVLHVASALVSGCREFVSFDARQATLAQAAGLVWCSP
ncbi:MAG: type II toxin-antitoxin system VapC family toxin [Verrucomicrobiae bacterium]|nr:type II toxin-antitoxin system VapC family toxin [Verrucomicrobiae bacterium]